MQKLVLIRGLPGSGKSTIAKREYVSQGYVLCEADEFFMVDGEYLFNGAKIKEAYAYCQSKAEQALSSLQNVVVANTFTQHWEMEFYKKLAEKYQATIKIITANGNYKNIHNVPEAVVNKMKTRWEK